MAINIDNMYLAKPCSAKWDDMPGDERARHCGACKLNVYNFAEMTRAEIEKLLIEKEGKVCGLLYKRPDGTVLTKDCPVGLARIRRRVALLSGALAASIFLAAGTVLARVGLTQSNGEAPAKAVKDWLVKKQLPPQKLAVPGGICIAPPTTTPLPVPVPAPQNSTTLAPNQ